MKNRYGIVVFGILAMFALLEEKSNLFADVAPSSLKSKKIQSKTAGEKDKNSTQWQQKMQDLYKALVEITTYTSSDRLFNLPGNKLRIRKNAKMLADRAHDLSKKGISPDADPTIQIIADLFQDETKQAYSALMSGNRSYARDMLSRVSTYCIACHTRNNSGPSFSKLPFEPTAKNLYPIELGRFYAATRQYDRALDLFQKIVNDPSSPIARPLEWDQAVRYGLAISVRVKNDPDQARALVERVIGSRNAPFFLKEDAQKWKNSIVKWKEELPQKALTEEGLRVEALELISEARKLQQYPMDHAADILYLRASAVIHELLQKAPNGRYLQDALLMAGLCYDVLRPLNLEDIQELYYESCIKKGPHTLAAEACYKRYEQSIYEGYTGSAGTFIPGDVKRKLKQLENLAHPENSSIQPLN